MKYYIGIDGGGTKTVFALMDGLGHLLGTYQSGSAFYKQIGVQGLLELLKTGINEVCKYAGEENVDIASTCFGMPAYGESPKNDQKIVETIQNSLPEYHIHVVNDCEVGWAASLMLEPGINIVAGTGSIAFGKNEKGETARCGGWSEWFSDEGSGRWLGMKCIQIFSKEADGRLPKGALYDLVREHFSVTYDEEIIDIFESSYLQERDKIAALQRILLEAAKRNDMEAVKAYEEAAEELYQIVCGVKNQLFKEKDCMVSYSGGIFNVGEMLLTPFSKKIMKSGMSLSKPKSEPYFGAALLARQMEEKV